MSTTTRVVAKRDSALPDSPVGRARPWRRPPPGLLAIGLCLIALVAAAWVATGVFDRLPHVEDEVAYMFQAKTIASGHIVADSPAQPEFFEVPFIILRDGEWFGKYPPGYPAVLALGVLVGQPWLINPLFGALSVGLLYLAGRRLYGVPTGLLAAALALASPFFLLQAGSLLSHVVSLSWVLAFLLLFQAAQGKGSGAAALFAGSALGMLVLSRPLTAAGVAIPYALWAGMDVLRLRRRLLAYLPMVLGFLPFLAGLLAYNYLTTGDPLREGHELWWPYDRIGFGVGIGVQGSHTLGDGLLNTGLNMEALADYLFGWPGRLSLFPASLAAALAIMRLSWQGMRRLGRIHQKSENGRGGGFVGYAAPLPEAWDLLQAGVVVSLVLVHIAYWTAGQMYGPRYYLEALGALALLSARGLLQVAALASALLRRAVHSRHPQAWARGTTLLAVAGLIVHSYGNFAPQEFGRFTRWYDVDGSGLRLVQAAGLKNAVVFVEEAKWTDYAPFFSQNIPSLDSDVVYAIDLGSSRNGDLMALYPGRAFFRYAEGRLESLPAR